MGQDEEDEGEESSENQTLMPRMPEMGLPTGDDRHVYRGKRRTIMQAVRRQRTRPEEVVAARLRTEGLRFRRNVAKLPGKPDF